MDGDAVRRRPGRPRVRDKPGLPAQYVGFRASHELKEQLEKAAAASGRSLSTEAQFRLEASFRDDEALFSTAHRQLALRLFGIYLVEGVAGVMRRLTGLPDPVTFALPDEAEKKRRYEVMRATMAENRWASPEAEARWQERQQKLDEWNAALMARAEQPAAEPDDEAA
jgi:hypothetical protein